MIITAGILTNIESIIGHKCKAAVGMTASRFGVMKLMITSAQTSASSTKRW